MNESDGIEEALYENLREALHVAEQLGRDVRVGPHLAELRAAPARQDVHEPRHARCQRGSHDLVSPPVPYGPVAFVRTKIPCRVRRTRARDGPFLR